MKHLLLLMVLALSMAACTPKQAPKAAATAAIVEVKLNVHGMYCTDCELSIVKGVKTLAGIDSISANYKDSTAFVRFDSSKTNLKDISKAIEDRGFLVASK
jgi:copper chaperone CopZ